MSMSLYQGSFLFCFIFIINVFQSSYGKMFLMFPVWGPSFLNYRKLSRFCLLWVTETSVSLPSISYCNFRTNFFSFSPTICYGSFVSVDEDPLLRYTNYELKIIDILRVTLCDFKDVFF